MELSVVGGLDEKAKVKWTLKKLSESERTEFIWHRTHTHTHTHTHPKTHTHYVYILYYCL